MRYLRIFIAVICQINLQQKVFGLDPQYYSCKEFHVSAFVFRLLSIGNAFFCNHDSDGWMRRTQRKDKELIGPAGGTCE